MTTPGNAGPQLGSLEEDAKLELGSPGDDDPGSAGHQPGSLGEEAKLGLGGPEDDDPGSARHQSGSLGEEAKLGLGGPEDDDPGSARHQSGSLGEEAKLGLGGPGEGWYSRGYLPHFDSTHVLQSITFRLADSLPQTTLRQLEEELNHVPPTDQSVERRKRIEHWLDVGMGCCALGHPQVAAVMQDTLTFFEPERYDLIAWCVMPNHVHVLIEPRVSLSKIVRSWKSYTGRWALERNAKLGLKIPGAELELGDPGRRFWMRDYWDRYIRDERHFHQAVAYIHGNPVKAGLCREPWDWPWSSAYPRSAGHQPG